MTVQGGGAERVHPGLEILQILPGASEGGGSRGMMLPPTGRVAGWQGGRAAGWQGGRVAGWQGGRPESSKPAR